MSGTLVSQNIKIENLHLGDSWNICEDGDGKLSFKHHETSQMTLEPQKE